MLSLDEKEDSKTTHFRGRPQGVFFLYFGRAFFIILSVMLILCLTLSLLFFIYIYLLYL